MHYYLFQLGDDSTVEILEHINSGGEELSLPFRSHRDEASAGDQVVLWKVGTDAYAWGAGEISGPEDLAQHRRSYREPERGNAPRPAFPLSFDGMLNRNVTRDELRAHPAFADFPFEQANVRNPFELTEAQYDAIFDLAGNE